MTNTYLYTFEPELGLKYTLLETPNNDIKVIHPNGELLPKLFQNETQAIRSIEATYPMELFLNKQGKKI